MGNSESCFALFPFLQCAAKGGKLDFRFAYLLFYNVLRMDERAKILGQARFAGGLVAGFFGMTLKSFGFSTFVRESENK